MNRQVFLVSAAGAVLLTFPAAAEAQIVRIVHTPTKAGIQSDVGTTRIVVTGSTENKYDKVITTSLDAWVSVSAPDKPPRDKSKLGGSISIEGHNAAGVSSGFSGAPTIFKLTFPYMDPRSQQVANQRISPIQLCNDRLASLSGAAREKFRNEGGNILRTDAYIATATQGWEVRKQGSVFTELKYWNDTAGIPAVVACQRLTGPKPREKSTAKPAGPSGPPAKKMEPTLAKVTLRGEPQGSVTVAGQTCPAQVRLYGMVEVRRAFTGKTIFLGPAFLTPPRDLVFAGPGTQNIIGTYNVKWAPQGAKSLAVGAGGTPAPLKQTVTLRMNVANAEGKVLETVQTTETLTCKPAGAPTRLRS